MNLRVVCKLILILTVVVSVTPSLFAQKGEISPYAGMFWPDGSGVGKLKSDGIYGVRFGYFFDSSFELEGNIGYINHFEARNIDPEARGLLWEVVPTYNFSEQDWPLPAKFTPYLSMGVGGVTTRLKDPDTFTYDVLQDLQIVGAGPLTQIRQVTISGGDTFFTVSAGGGFKANRLWGPVGLRGDVRARLLPNYYGTSPIWLEATGGINFVWGER